MRKYKKQKTRKIVTQHKLLQSKSPKETLSLWDIFVNYVSPSMSTIGILGLVIQVEDVISLPLKAILIMLAGTVFFIFAIKYKPIGKTGKHLKNLLNFGFPVLIFIILFIPTNFFQQESTMTVEQLALAQAEALYYGELYEHVVELYTSENLLENPIANNNLGYMYSQGIYFEENIQVAKEYYKFAAHHGLKEASHNLVALQFRDCKTFEQVIDTLKYGYLVDDTATILFLASCIQGEQVSAEIMEELSWDQLETKIKEFFNADTAIQTEILLAALGPWQYDGKITVLTPYSGQSIFEDLTLLWQSYQFVRDDYDNLQYVYAYEYSKSTRQFLYSEFLEEHFVTNINDTHIDG